MMTDLEKQAERIRAKLAELGRLTEEMEALVERTDKLKEKISLVSTEVQAERRGMVEITEKGKTFEEVHYLEIHGASVPEWPGVGEWPTSKAGRFILASTRGGDTRPIYIAFEGAEGRAKALEKIKEMIEWREQVCSQVAKQG